MDFHQVLDSLVQSFADHHNDQVLDQSAARNPEWLHDDKLWGSPVTPDHQGYNNKGQIQGNTLDQMPMAVPRKDFIHSDTPYSPGDQWNYGK